MIYYVVVFLCVGILSIALIYLKHPFIRFAYSTTGLLNIMLDKSMDEDSKQKVMIRKLTSLLRDFALFLLFLLISCILAFIPVYIYMLISKSSYKDLDTHSFYFYLAMILGSVILFIFPNKDKGLDYNDWTKLLHRMILDNYNISRGLFNFERKKYKKKIRENNNNFVIVTGLARGGTTALTNLLYKTNKFYSLSYNNMPFLLSVNIWHKFYNPKKNNLKERAHGDNIKFGYKTIEALEEYFYKAQLNDAYIKENTLIKHEITEDIYNKYISYQQLVGLKNKDKIYLAKNNNLILRYNSLRKFNKDFHIMMMVRNPIEHAESLMQQHKKFSEKHLEDPFSLEYMNWLGHHEFGLNHKPFQLKSTGKPKYSIETLNYWVYSWIDYYKYVLDFLDKDDKLYIIDYKDLCVKPDKIIGFISDSLNIEINSLDLKPYKPPLKEFSEVDSDLINKSKEIYNKLLAKKVQLS